ncbi:MAG: Flp pilus assembly protein CpaB [Methylobacterium sp.]|uniref:Flp pilus assembly protein CpaB n=1 Tax=Methylobacterium sp. TaxID=409 RepID=UPI0025CE27A5|nr:Flp pilus assembly protein CpaB [Methylobacterium sp.]MBX9932646.1 Flp pilus assembly protein CpaB [Methylobacterium sp.]
MKPARLAVLGIAILTGCAAVYLMSDGEAPPPSPVAMAPPPAVPVTDVLVAAAELPMGQTIRVADLRWQPWPDQAITAGYITRTASPKGLEEIAGSVVRSAFLPGEPVRSQKLAKPDGGFMAAILPAGMRAVAITIDTRGSSSAGNFILPNDHVDLIRTFRDEDTSRSTDSQTSETLLTDVRVLAVGQIVQEKNGAAVVTGETATLALTPAQAEVVTLAQKVGSLSLSLRSLADAGRAAEPDATSDSRSDGAVTVVRFGVAKQQSRR